ncbi:MAG: LysR substrate-binding domain-containing protein, partial [Kiloniellaceae bacterium]
DSLKQALLRLRRSLGGELRAPLIANRRSVTLDPETVDVDVIRFERGLRQNSLEALEQAVALYRGELLEDSYVRDAAFEDWLAIERQRLRGLAVDAATALMERSLAAGERERAAGAARCLLLLDSLNERACRALMRIHAERGERAQALKLFGSLRDRLARELSVTPESETVRLYDSLRARGGTGAADTAWSSALPEISRADHLIRVSAQPAFASRWLIRRLDRFRADWPECEVVLDATPRVVDLNREGADIAIRRGLGHWPGLTQDLLVNSHVFPVASPDYLPQRKGAWRPQDLMQLTLLHDDDGCLWRDWLAAGGITGSEAGRGPRILESGLAIEAAIAGQGVALADQFLVAEDLACGRLVKLCDHAVADWDYYLVTPEGKPQSAPVTAFRMWLLRDTEPLRQGA